MNSADCARPLWEYRNLAICLRLTSNGGFRCSQIAHLWLLLHLSCLPQWWFSSSFWDVRRNICVVYCLNLPNRLPMLYMLFPWHGLKRLMLGCCIVGRIATVVLGGLDSLLKAVVIERKLLNCSCHIYNMQYYSKLDNSPNSESLRSN